MTTENTTWENAILIVLKGAESPLHYKDIAHQIADRNLVASRGATPEITVNSYLGRLVNQDRDEKVERVSRGYYRIGSTPLEGAKVDDDISLQEENNLAQVTAYGLYWERNKVYWDPGQGKTRQYKLPGCAFDSDEIIDFGDQWGIYLLYDGSTVVYVGRTMNSLFDRLSSHNTGSRRNSRWDRFSWFGFRAVNENHVLSDAQASFTTGMLVTILESVMIEGFMPPLNDKGGELLGTIYRQIEAPELIDQREHGFLRMLGRAINRD